MQGRSTTMTRKSVFLCILIIINIIAVSIYLFIDIKDGSKWMDKLIENNPSTIHELKLFKFQTFNVYQSPEVFHLRDKSLGMKNYFGVVTDKLTCFLNGTNWSAMNGNESSTENCICLDQWQGSDCGIPNVIWESLRVTDQEPGRLVRRKIPRRIIHALNVNHEFKMLEIRVHELEEIVDVYLLCESNFTASGEPKELNFLRQFQEGFLGDFQHKIVYVLQDHFPEGGRDDGWIADSYQRTFAGQQGMKQLKGVRSDDIFLILDADEIPKKEVLTFLKLYDGYNEPINLHFHWTVFGYFWRMPDGYTDVSAACTVNMFQKAMGYDGNLLRRGAVKSSLEMSYFGNGGRFSKWFIGTPEEKVGWHCSWCMTPEDIRIKLEYAQNGDQPRWGDYPEKTNLSYIRHLIRTGTWFDDTKRFEKTSLRYRDYAPSYAINHADKFRFILINPYEKK